MMEKHTLTCDNRSAPVEAWNSPQGLTRSSDLTREGLGMQPTRKQEPIDRFLRFVTPGRREMCWEWQGNISSTGYGGFYFGSADPHSSHKMGTAHRFAYEHWVGPVPKGLELDHLCRNRLCVNPWHLEPVTPDENKRRMGVANRRVYCRRGHELTESNTYRRQCRICKNATRNAWSKKNAARRKERLSEKVKCATCGRLVRRGSLSEHRKALYCRADPDACTATNATKPPAASHGAQPGAPHSAHPPQNPTESHKALRNAHSRSGA